MQKGLFIVVEGGDFSGKTTFVKQLKEVLDEVDFSNVLFRSPGGDEAGEKIRKLVTETPFSEEVRTLLFAANRVHLTQNLVKPLTSKGINVISTRWRWKMAIFCPIACCMMFQHNLENIGRKTITKLMMAPFLRGAPSSARSMCLSCCCCNNMAWRNFISDFSGSG